MGAGVIGYIEAAHGYNLTSECHCLNWMLMERKTGKHYGIQGIRKNSNFSLCFLKAAWSKTMKRAFWGDLVDIFLVYKASEK